MSDSEDMKRYLQEVGQPTEEQLNSSLDPKKYLQDLGEDDTFEKKYLEPNVYPVVGALTRGIDMAATPVQAAISIPVQAASAMQRKLTLQPDEDFINPIRHPVDAANKYGSSHTFYDNIPGMEEPIAPNFTSKEFPKAASVISRVSKADAAALPTDIVLTEGLAKTGGLLGIGDRLKDAASSNREIALINNSGLDNATNVKLSNNKVFRRIGDLLNEYGISDQLKSPQQLHETLVGTTKQIPDEFTGVLQPVRTPGLLKEEGQKVQSLLQVADPKVPKVLATDIADGVFSEIKGKKAGKNSAVPGGWTPNDDIKLQKQVIDITGSDEKSLKDLIELKRNIQDTVFNMTDEQRAALAQKYPNYKEIYESTWKWIDNYVNAAAESDQDVKNFVQQNARYSDLKTASQLLEGSRMTHLETPSLIQSVGTVEAGKEMGIPFMGREMRQKVGYISRKAPATIAQIQENLGGALDNPLAHPKTVITPATGASMQNQADKSPQDVPYAPTRAPQSVPDLQQQTMMQKGLVMNLANYQIPRDTNQILSNPKLAIAKVAQVTNNPQIVDMLGDALENHPEKLETVLPVIIKMYPNLFESDKYDRVNGKILDPMIRQKAYQDVQNSALTNTQKIMLQDGLNRDGTLKGF